MRELGHGVAGGPMAHGCASTSARSAAPTRWFGTSEVYNLRKRMNQK